MTDVTIHDIREIAAESAREIVADCLKYAALQGHTDRQWIDDYLGNAAHEKIAGSQYDTDVYWSIVYSNRNADDPVRYDESSCGDSDSSDLDDVIKTHADRILKAIWEDALFDMLDEVIGSMQR